MKTIAALGLSLALLSAAVQADTYVRPHVRSDGTYVRGHIRSAPDGSTYNNYSTRGNVNPYTGKSGYTSPYRQPSPYGTRRPYASPYDR